jgi:hypothetical protein
MRFYTTTSTRSTASQASRTSPRTREGLDAVRHQALNAWEPRVKQSATRPSSGRVPKRPGSVYATTSRDQQTWPAWRTNMTKDKP